VQDGNRQKDRRRIHMQSLPHLREKSCLVKTIHKNSPARYHEASTSASLYAELAANTAARLERFLGSVAP